MQKIYPVTSGEYSNYNVEAIFSDIEMAKKYAKLHSTRWEELRVEEWEMDTITIEDLETLEKNTQYYWEFEFTPDGSLLGSGRYKIEYPDIMEDGIIENKIPTTYRAITTLRIKVCERNKTYEQCLKCALDMRAKHLAEREGLC